MLAKKIHYNNLISKSNNKPKTTWNIVRTITSNRNTNNNITTMNVKNKFSSNSLKIANAFNSHFLLVAENLLIKNFYGKNTNNHIDPLSYLQQNFRHFSIPMKVKNTTTHEIDRIHSIKSKDSSGYDEISSRILKISAPYVLSPLTFIFNKILDMGVFPERLKFSEVKPLYKKGDATDFSNYRPISILTSFSKIIEKIIYKRLYSYLINNNILVNEQFGFREKLSTDTATYAFLNKVLSSLDKRNYVGGLFCDLQKVFDCVNHNILLDKMKFYGRTGLAHKLIRSYLDNRYQRVTMKDSKYNKLSSTWEHVKHGVPQGSVLGPLLFLTYINDFPLTINKLASSILFADDMSIIISDTNPEEFTNTINSVMTEIMDWFQSNLLTLNFDKTTFL